MFKTWLSALALLTIALPNVAVGQGLRTTGHWHGTCNGDNVIDHNELCNPTFCEGELLRCPDGESINFGRVTYYYIEKICDDSDPGATACDGRYTTLYEECFNPNLDRIQLGTVVVSHARGAYRLCFDTNGDIDGLSDCDGDDATLQAEGAIIIGEGSYRTTSRSHGNAGGMFTGESTAFDKINIRFTDPVDGMKKKLSASRTITLFSGDGEDVEPFTCAIAGSDQAVR